MNNVVKEGAALNSLLGAALRLGADLTSPQGMSRGCVGCSTTYLRS